MANYITGTERYDDQNHYQGFYVHGQKVFDADGKICENGLILHPELYRTFTISGRCITEESEKKYYYFKTEHVASQDKGEQTQVGEIYYDADDHIPYIITKNYDTSVHRDPVLSSIGMNNTLCIGNIEFVAKSGSSPKYNGEITINGDSPNQCINFKIPIDKGADGAKGDKGDPGQNGKDGKDGKDGKNGQNGITPHIGINGNWFLGDTDTTMPSQGPQGPQGNPGKNGKNGLPGKEGKPGLQGIPGETPYIGNNGNWFIKEQDTTMPSRGAQGQKGETGNTPTLILNPTTTLLPFEQARVDMIKDPNIKDQYQLSFAIPRGDVMRISELTATSIGPKENPTIIQDNTNPLNVKMHFEIPQGVTFKPHVERGVISWSNNGGLANPASEFIRGNDIVAVNYNKPIEQNYNEWKIALFTGNTIRVTFEKGSGDLFQLQDIAIISGIITDYEKLPISFNMTIGTIIDNHDNTVSIIGQVVSPLTLPLIPHFTLDEKTGDLFVHYERTLPE